MGDVLIVDDEKDIRELVSDILEDEGYSTRLAANSDETFAAVAAKLPKLIILDIWLKASELDGIDILVRLNRSNPDIPIVIISGHGNIEIAVAAIKQGAYDFIEKPFNMDQLMVVIGRAMETSKLRSENANLRRQDTASVEMTGKSAAFRTLRSQLDKVSSGNSRIMLRGGSGVGKELAARYIHAQSERASAPFVTVNCATIESERMEEILFGANDQPGLVEEANDGVLFFDEVTDLSKDTQSKILRALVGNSVQRVGSTEKLDVDIRVISATNKDLEKEIKAGAFREELFHRLNVIPIEVPDLSKRREDIPDLANHFVERIALREGLQAKKIGPDAMSHLQDREWPGNIRQLRNVIERALILGGEKGEISLEDVEIRASSDGSEHSAPVTTGLISLPLREAREQFEKEYLVAQINRFDGNISKTASFVGMERSALHRKLKLLNVKTVVETGKRVAIKKQLERE